MTLDFIKRKWKTKFYSVFHFQMNKKADPNSKPDKTRRKYQNKKMKNGKPNFIWLTIFKQFSGDPFLFFPGTAPVRN